MILKDIWYDNRGIARAIILSNSGKEYNTCLDSEYNRFWCSCPASVYNKDEP